MGLLDVLRGGEAEARDDADGNSDVEQQPEREETGLLGGLMHAVDHLKEFVGVDDDADEPPAHQAEASSSHQLLTQGVEVAAVGATRPSGALLPPLQLSAEEVAAAGDDAPALVTHDYTQLVAHSMDGDIEYVRREVEEHGIELSVAATIRIRDDDGTIDEYTVTPLQAAALGNHPELIIFLLEQSVAVDDCQSDARAWTALFYAVDMGNTEAIGALLTQSAFARANPNHPDHRGNTPLHVVCKADWNNFNDQLEMVNLLLDNGADVNKCNSKGESPLMLLVSRPHTAEAVLDRLLREGRDEGQGEEQGETAVHLDVQDRKRHDTALHRCVMHNNVSAFEALTAAGANLLIQNRPPSDKKDDPPMTPLLAALGKATFAQWLLDHPKYLLSLSLILSLVSIFEANSKKNPAFGPEFRTLAASASELTLSLLDLCEDAEAHYLISGAKVPYGSVVLAARFGDLEADALDTAIDLNHPVLKPFLAHRCVHNELNQLWIGHVWDHQRGKFVPPRNRKLWTITPQRSMQSFNFFYVAYLFIWGADVVYKKRRVNADSWSPTEIATYTYMCGFGLKEMYSVVRQRLSYFEEKWNVMDAILITLHLTTFILRASPGEKGMKLTNDQRMMGMQPDDVPANFTQDIYTLILSLNLLVSTARLLWMFNFDPALGPLQLMMARMVKDVTRFVVLFVVAFAGFVLAIYQMCRNNDIEEVATVSDTAWQLVWATLGNPNTDWITYDNLNSDMMVYGTMTLYALYLFLSTVMLINLLIAMMSSTYDTIQVNVDVEWKAEWAIMVKFLSREQSILEFSPPLNLLCVPYWLCKKIYRWRQSMRQVRDVFMNDVMRSGTASPEAQPEDQDDLEDVIDSVTAVVRSVGKKKRDTGSAVDFPSSHGQRGLPGLGGELSTEEALAREQEAVQRKAVELFQEVAQRYQDKKNSDPDREEREQHAARVQALLVENQELLQQLFNTLITVPGVKRPNQTAGDVMANTLTPSGTKGLHSESFISPKISSGLFGSKLGDSGGGGPPRVLSPSATVGHGVPRRETLINLPPLSSKSFTELGGSGGGTAVLGHSGSVASAPAETAAPVTTMTRSKAGKKKKMSGKTGAKKTPPKAK